jgi:hypothetical protein
MNRPWKVGNESTVASSYVPFESSKDVEGAGRVIVRESIPDTSGTHAAARSRPFPVKPGFEFVGSGHRL